MADIIFYEKPGCGGNARQKTLLLASGHRLEVKSLLSEPWTPESLRPFFGSKPVTDWFNRASPRVKSGEIVPEAMEEEAALAAMLQDHLLIRRPLMQVGFERRCGFDQAGVNEWIGVKETAVPVTDVCLKSA
jgi:nitrogenase-associated protein